MNTRITLSYIVTTFNKLPYLKLVMNDLIENLELDEEIVVADGGSTDGTKEYLKELFNTGKIKKFISEKDKGEAHGFNKAILLSEGELIKIITDDDVFHYPSVKGCKKFMLEHKNFDFIGGNTGNVQIGFSNEITWSYDFEKDYNLWKEKIIKNFFFNGTCLMLRRSSLPLLGLFRTDVLLVDMEYTLRTTLVANLVWCRSIISVRILNEQSNNNKFKLRSGIEDKKLSEFYNYKHPNERRLDELEKISLYKKTRRKVSKLKNWILQKERNEKFHAFQSEESFEDVYTKTKKWIYTHPMNSSIEFYY